MTDARVGALDPSAMFTDAELEGLIPDYVAAAKFAAEDGYDFVDVKCCHGYLLNELLAAHTRPGPYGGSFENRTRLFREIVAAIRRDVPDFHIGVRLSAFDLVPFRHPRDGRGERAGCPSTSRRTCRGGMDSASIPTTPAVRPRPSRSAFSSCAGTSGIRLVNISAACPYYNPHLMRPAMFPPSDGYPPPEDPLVGVARILEVAATLKRAVPGPAARRQRVHLSAGVPPARRPGPGPARPHRFRRRGPDAAVPIRSCRTMYLPDGPWTGSASAAPSATARPAPATVWSPAAFRLTHSTRRARRLRPSTRSDGKRPARFAIRRITPLRVHPAVLAPRRHAACPTAP